MCLKRSTDCKNCLVKRDVYLKEDEQKKKIGGKIDNVLASSARGCYCQVIKSQKFIALFACLCIRNLLLMTTKK